MAEPNGQSGALRTAARTRPHKRLVGRAKAAPDARRSADVSLG